MCEKNVVVILCDALRPDFLGCYGNKKVNTPNIDKLAEEGVFFTNAFSQSSFTNYSVASLFTGLNVKNHGIRERGLVLEEKFTTLAQRLEKAGYSTILVSESPGSRLGGMKRGFQEIYSEKYSKFEIFIFKILRRLTFGKTSRNFLFRIYEDTSNCNFLVQKTKKLLKNKEKPFFLYLHLMDTHYPFSVPFDGREKLQELRDKKILPTDLYNHSIEAIDSAVGKLISWVKKNFGQTIFIILSDHGVNFNEHGHYLPG